MDKQVKALVASLGSIAAIAAVSGICLYFESKNQTFSKLAEDARDEVDRWDLGSRFQEATDYVQNRRDQLVDNVSDVADDALKSARKVRRLF